MNFIIKTLLIVVSFILVCSCTKSHNEISYIDGKLVLKTFYPSGKLKELSFLDSDSLKNGISVQYYENGDTALISKYANGVKDSIETEIYKSRELKGLRSWFKHQLWNEYIEYYDGQKDIYFTAIDGDTVKVEEPLIKTYTVYSYLGDIKYQRKFDKKGILISESGNAILIVKLDKARINIEESISIQFYPANPRWVDREFQIQEFDPSGELLLSKDLPVNDEYNAVFYQTSFTQPGKYKITGILKLSDMYFENIKTDSVSVEVLVKGEDI